MNYFELFGIPVTLQVEEDILKQRYYELGKRFYPDMHAGAGEEVQAAMLEKWLAVATGYKILGDANERLRHVLEQHGTIVPGEKMQLPEHFLLEMTDLAEHIAALETDPDEKAYGILKSSLDAAEEEMEEEAQPVLHGYEYTNTDEGILEELKFFYFKKKYFLQINKRLSTFASRN